MSNLPDAQLLFGLLALQTGLIDQARLVAAFQAWTLDRSKGLADHLDLNDADRSLIEALASRHLQKYGDTKKSLASVEIGQSTREQLQSLAEPDLNATLTHVGQSATNPDRTGTYHAISVTSDGQRFRVLRPHARGGLGAVFVALDSELNREVALKQILDHHADNPTSRARFLVEAEITGGLEHPGIVPVYGLGNYEDGRPYYAMRFIQGDSLRESIDEFHKKRRSRSVKHLELRQLLRRFTDICNAIDYAHSRGVLHRDIKPGNVIVGKHGETLVVDWGLAKAMGKSAPDAVERTLMPSSSADGPSETLPGQALGTPAYMSPEQARGDLEKLGPRSDVYSLGATLYHLLTGQPPFQGSVEAVLKAVGSGVFRRPRLLDAAIDPALEAIVLKAMATDPADRYGSARNLAEEIDRWLADERVEAYPEPWTRTLNRWLARHRTGVTGLATAGIVAIIGLAIVSVVQTTARKALDAKNIELTRANVQLSDTNAALDLQRQRAEANESQAIDAVKRFKDAIADNPELKDNPELRALRATLLKEPLTFFGQLREQLQARNDARPEALVRLAGIIHDHADLADEIGDPTDGLKAHDDCLAIWERLTRAQSDRDDYQSTLAKIEFCRGNFLRRTGDHSRARAAYERALAIRERLLRDHPTTIEYQADLARCHHNLAVLLNDTGQPEAARESYERAVAVFQRLATDHPDEFEYQAALANGQHNLGSLFHDGGHLDEARAAFERAITIQERLAHDQPSVTHYQAELASSHLSLGNLLKNTGHSDEARATYERAITILERLVRDQPTVNEFQSDLARSQLNLGSLFDTEGRTEAARGAYERTISILERLVRDQPSVTDYEASLASGLHGLATLLSHSGQLDEARASFERTIGVQERLARNHPEVREYQAELAASHNNLGSLLRALGRADEARAAYEKALAILEQFVRDHSETPDQVMTLGGAWNNLATIDLDSGRFAEAREKLLKAISWQKRALDTNPRHPQYRLFYENHLNNLILAERGLNHDDEADRIERELAEFRRGDPKFENLDARLKAVLGGARPSDNTERLALAQRAYDLRHFAAAAKLWSDATESDPKLVDDRKAQHRYNAACASALAADGQGDDSPEDDADQVRLRGQALTWLQAERDTWLTLLEAGLPNIRESVAQTLRHWQVDTDLASVRDPDSIAKLPEAERQSWQDLWASVAELQRKVE